MTAALDRSDPTLDRVLVDPPEHELDRFLAHSLRAACAERAVVQVALPAPALRNTHALLRGLVRSASASFTPPGGIVQLAHGTAAVISLSGENRLAALRDARRELFIRTLRCRHDDAPFDRSPRLYGGLAFTVGSADRDPWAALGDGRFFLPRWSYEAGTLFAAVDLRDGNPQRIANARTELGRVLEIFRAPPRPPAAARKLHELETDRARWSAWLDHILSAIDRGEVEKVVAARHQRLFADRDIDSWQVLEQLSASYPSTYRVALRFGRETLLAASPERLLSKRGRALSVDALAGTIDARADNAASILSRCDKDRREHRLVTEHIAQRLGPFAARIHAPSQPLLKHLPNVLHLYTPTEVWLRDGVEPEDLIATLHPTPAVAGTPSDLAARMIAEHEPAPRGWYCGPVGWIDADGDAELAIALRCGLVRGASAWLYAGGGIVRGSTHDREWREASWKLRPMRDALGASHDES